MAGWHSAGAGRHRWALSRLWVWQHGFRSKGESRLLSLCPWFLSSAPTASCWAPGTCRLHGYSKIFSPAGFFLRGGEWQGGSLESKSACGPPALDLRRLHSCFPCSSIFAELMADSKAARCCVLSTCSLHLCCSLYLCKPLPHLSSGVFLLPPLTRPSDHVVTQPKPEFLSLLPTPYPHLPKTSVPMLPKGPLTAPNLPF